MTSEIGGTPEDVQLQQHILGLVEPALNGRSDRARRARRDLISSVVGEPYINPSLWVLRQMQDRLLLEKSPQRIKDLVGFINDFSFQVSQNYNGRVVGRVMLDQKTVSDAEAVAQSVQRIEKNRYISPMLSGVYFHLQGLAGEVARKSQANVGHFATIITQRGIHDRIFNERLDHWDQWEGKADDVFRAAFDRDADNNDGVDGLIDFLKSEPVAQPMRARRYFDAHVGEVSLSQIEKWQYPLNEEQLESMTTYLASISKTELKTFTQHLFLLEIYFSASGSVRPPFRHNNLVSNINQWQSHFVSEFILNPQREEDERYKGIITSLGPRARLQFVLALALHTTHPNEHDPDFLPVEHGLGVNHFDYEKYPLSKAGFESFFEWQVQNPQETGYSYYASEILMRFWQDKVSPSLKGKFERLGLLETFEPYLDSVPTDFSENHLSAIGGIFEKNAGREFLDKLDTRAEEIDEVTELVRADILKRSHFLPMAKGENLVEFSQGSTPSILGIDAISVVSVGTNEESKALVVFWFKDNTLSLHGILGYDGSLEFKAPFETRTPGLYKMLKHIATLTLHDLTVQQELEQTGKGAVFKRTHQADSSKPTDVSRRVYGELPRVQSDTELKQGIYQGREMTPRRVEIHRAYLRYNKEYKAAIDLYNEAVKTGAPQETIDWIAVQLEDARAMAYKSNVSAGKVENKPSIFDLEQIVDPVTGVSKYLRTWVVEHTSPRPTDEELASPVKLYERYYRGLSSLASLDQMLPWFIGE